MAYKKNIDLNELENLAWTYILECENNHKAHPTASGKLVNIKDRHIPTVQYFLQIWLPSKGKTTISRQTYYKWLRNEDDHAKNDTIKNIEGLFKALAEDIVANEAKGIFYAKNRLGMTDRTDIKTDNFEPIQISFID